MASQPLLGSVRPAPASDYSDTLVGYVIEQFRYIPGVEDPCWCVPAWEEMGAGDLCGTFGTYNDAMVVIKEHWGTASIRSFED